MDPGQSYKQKTPYVHIFIFIDCTTTLNQFVQLIKQACAVTVLSIDSKLSKILCKCHPLKASRAILLLKILLAILKISLPNQQDVRF